MKKVLKKQNIALSKLLLCAEYTGQYTYPLACVCEELKVNLWLENPVQIKHSSDITRGRNDKLDARKITGYAFRFQEDEKRFMSVEDYAAKRRRLQRQIKEPEVSIREVELEID